MDVSRVPAQSVGNVWDALLPMIERGLSHGTGDCTTPELMRAAIERGENLLWVVHDGDEIAAGLVLSVQQYPAKKTLFVEMLAGRDMDLWAEQIETLLREFRDLIGAETIEANCRAGLAKRLRKRGWGVKAEILELAA